MKRLIFALTVTMLTWSASVQASIAYGSLNNFDTVNDTGQPCHGFEIEIEDIHSRDITYTYDWNHYGTPTITEDNSNPLHPVVRVKYESKKNPDGSWAAYTAVPAGPINPTDGHQFTNPAVNFGGEHFGVGFYGVSGAVRYFWLLDDGAGNLVRGGIVNISTPTFVYYPPVNNVPAQVQPVIQLPPPPPAAPVLEFGDPMWVKVTTTQSHNNHKVELRDLVSDDPDDPNDENWKNGEPDEIEIEWQLMQTEFNKVDGGANGKMENAPQELPDGDEIITIRYDFYKYVGPIDEETGEAKTDNVGPDDLHGTGIKNINGLDVDLSTIVVVGDYVGAQMAGFDAAGQIGLIDHVQDGEVNVPYVERSMVIAGTPPVVTTRTGALPEGMAFDTVSGVLSGTPTQAGVFTFTLHSTDAAAGDVTMTYELSISDGIVVLPHYNIATVPAPFEGGFTSGDGDFEVGSVATVLAEANPGYQFVNWTENGDIVSTDAAYSFAVNVNRDLVANFELVAVQTYTITTSSSPVAGGNTTGGGVYEADAPVTIEAVATGGYTFVNWTVDGIEFSVDASISFNADADYAFVANFAAIPPTTYAVSTSAAPAAGGSTSGDGTYNEGDNVTVVATSNGGYTFLNWTEGPSIVSANANYSFPATADRSLVANFGRISYLIATSASPVAGGSASGGGTVNSGDTATVVAVANPGYEFVGWSEGGTVVSTSASYTFSADGNRNLVANFSRISYLIATSASPVAGGSVSGGGTVNSGDSATVVAVANPGYAFAGWSEGGAVVSTSASYTFSADGNRNLVANFTLIPVVTYTVTTSALPTAGGTTSGGGTVDSGASVTVKAVAAAGYAFANWTELGVVVSTSASYTFTASANRALVANFTPVSTTGTICFLKVLSPVLGGNKSLGVVSVSKPAPAGGLKIAIASSNPSVLGVPASVTVPAGKVSASFTVTAAKVSKAVNVNVTATLGTSKKTSSVRVIPRR